MFPSEPRNVRTGNSDIGQFAVVQARKFLHCSAIALPGVEEPDDRQKHFAILSTFVVESQRHIGSQCRTAKWNCCSAARSILHVISNNFTTNGPSVDDFASFGRISASSAMLVTQCHPAVVRIGGLMSIVIGGVAPPRPPGSRYVKF